MLSELCAELRNYFVKSDKDKHAGTFTINSGEFSPPLDFLQDGQYYAIFGSVFNDGVHEYGRCTLKDETFDGSVWAMSIPMAFLELADRIAVYQYSDAARITPYTSESFGGYSYTKATGNNGAAAGWKRLFAEELNTWRRIAL